MRFPIGIQTFEIIRERDCFYVDKTDLVYELAKYHVCFLSRPRRFGKSLLVSTLDAYFSGKKELFCGLKMESLENTWEKYPIFRIDFSGGDFSQPDALTNKLEVYLAIWEEKYGKNDVIKNLSDRFVYVLNAAKEKTGKKVVVLIDEYDKPILDALNTESEEPNRKILRSFYSAFKEADASLRFVFLTGITKFSQVSIFSGFNQPKDISLSSKFEAICGITEAELYSYFAEPIIDMAEEKEMSVTELKAALKKQYDGYHFGKTMLDIYNPYSVLNALDDGDLGSYWYQSGTPTYLAKLLAGHNVTLQEYTEKLYSSDDFLNYGADIENPLAMIYQSGYLTIKGYDPGRSMYFLDLPNEEVRKSIVALLASTFFGKSQLHTKNWIMGIDDMFNRCDLDGVRDAFTSFLASIPYEANKNVRATNFETHFSYTFYLINRMLGCYTTLIEKQNSQGRADVIIESDKDIFIFEFKLDGSAKEALAQIEEKQYALPYLQDSRKIHKIGVNISSKTRTVDEWLVATDEDDGEDGGKGSGGALACQNSGACKSQSKVLKLTNSTSTSLTNDSVLELDTELDIF